MRVTMKSISEKKITKYMIFTVCFWGYVIPKLIHIFNLGLTMFGGWDAITQMFPTMVMIRRTLLDMFQSGSDFPMINWNVGMGADTLVTFNWHGLGDPLYLITIFFSEETLPYVYGVLFFFKVYLGGLSFICLAGSYQKKISNLAYVVGAFAYCFTGFTVQCNMHIIFTHYMYMLPLMLLGAERVMQGKKKWLLCVSTFLFALNGFYFLYIGSVVLAVYVLYRLYRNRCTLQNAILMTGKLLAEYLVGLGLAGAIFIPNVIGFLNSNRALTKINLPLFFDKEEIADSLINLFFPQISNYQVLSISTIGVISIIFLFLAKGKGKEKRNVAILLILTWIPFVSCVMSGFGEVYDRWEMAVLLYFAFLVMQMWDELVSLSRIQKVGATFIYLVILVWAKIKDVLADEKFSVTIVSCFLILMISVLILPLFKYFKKEKIGYLISFFIVVALICNGWSRAWRDREISYVQENYELRELLQEIDCDFYRIDNQKATQEPRNAQNVALLLNYPGIAEYFSIQNPYYTNALAKWGVTIEAFGSHMNLGLDERTVLESLCSVKYLIAKKTEETNVPYGFVMIKETADGLWELYENQYVLPLVYSYDMIYNVEDYVELSGFEKQQIMLQAAVVDAGYSGNVRTLDNVQNSLYETVYQIVDMEKGKVEDGVLKGEDGITMVLTVEMKAGCENYICLDNIVTSGEYVFQIENEMAKTASVESNMEDGRVGFNLGIPDSDKVVKVKVSIPGNTEYPVEQLQTFCYKFDKYAEQIAERKEETLSDLTVSGNRVSYSVNLKEDKIMCLAVPYSEGWKVRVDGEEVETCVVNDMFVGIDVQAGEHVIECIYTTPGVYIGILISGVSMLTVFLWILYNRKHNSLH